MKEHSIERRRPFYGSLLGGMPGALLPFALRRHPVAGAILDPYLIGRYGVPKLALAPLFILWFGANDAGVGCKRLAQDVDKALGFGAAILG